MQMSLVVAQLRKIANSGTTVLVVHHHKKGEGPLNQKLRGSSDIAGGVDIEYAVLRKDEYLEFSSVKTRTKPLEPIRLKMEVSKKEIQIVYAGTEAEEILAEVKDCLERKGRIGIEEISKALKEKGYEIGINRLRGLLKKAVGDEIQGEQEKQKPGKPWVFWVDYSLRQNPYLRGVNNMKSEEAETILHGLLSKNEDPREQPALDNQGSTCFSRVEKEGLREESEIPERDFSLLHGPKEIGGRKKQEKGESPLDPERIKIFEVIE